MIRGRRRRRNKPFGLVCAARFRPRLS